MKNTILIFLCLFLTTSLFAQSLKYLQVKDVPCDNAFSYENRNNANEGVLIFSTAIRNLNFKVPKSHYEIDKIDSTTINGYILTIKYDPAIANRKFNLTISGSKHKEYYLNTSVRQCYKLKSSSRKPFDWNEDFKIIAGLSNGIVAGEIVGVYGEIKFGERTGFALEGGYGVGIGKNDRERWSVGIKGLYKNFFLSAHYGTTMNLANKYTEFSMNDDGTFILAGNRIGGRYGVTLLSGYDRTFRWFHLTTGIGGTVTTTAKPKFLFAWNVGIGVSFMDLFNR